MDFENYTTNESPKEEKPASQRRRDFLKVLGTAGVAAAAPEVFANSSEEEVKEEKLPLVAQIDENRFTPMEQWKEIISQNYRISALDVIMNDQDAHAFEDAEDRITSILGGRDGVFELRYDPALGEEVENLITKIEETNIHREKTQKIRALRGDVLDLLVGLHRHYQEKAEENEQSDATEDLDEAYQKNGEGTTHEQEYAQRRRELSDALERKEQAMLSQIKEALDIFVQESNAFIALANKKGVDVLIDLSSDLD